MTVERLHPSDLVGQAEIAVRAGVSIPKVANWAKTESGFPKPVLRLACGYIFSWLQVSAWLTAEDLPGEIYCAGVSRNLQQRIVEQARQHGPKGWDGIAARFDVPVRLIHLLSIADRMGEDYGGFTRQRRKTAVA